MVVPPAHRTVDFSVAFICEAQIEADTGFHVLDHELKFYGQCKECAEASMRKENT